MERPQSVYYDDFTSKKCNLCGSSYPKKYVFFGKRKCINPTCKNNDKTKGA